MKPRLVATIGAVVLVAAVVVVTAAAVGPERVSLDGTGERHVRVSALAVCVSIAAVPAVIGTRRLGATTALVAFAAATTVGSARYASSPRLLSMVVAILWLGSAAGGLAVLSSQATAALGHNEPRQRWAIAAAAMTAMITVAVDGGRGLGAEFGSGADGSVGAPARSALALHLIAVAVAVVVIVPRPRRWSALVRQPYEVAAWFWVGAIVIERGIHLLDQASYRDDFRGIYRPWALVVGVHLPLVAALTLVMAIGWSSLVRARYDRSSPGVIVLRERDPLSIVRDDLAAWLGDPSLQISFTDHDGRWPHESPPVSADAYDRGSTLLVRQDRVIGRLDHDVALLRSPESLATAAALAGTALEANQLLAIGRSRLEQAARLNQRLIDTESEIRSMLSAEMEAGALRRLEECADQLSWGLPLDDVAERLRGITTDVRHLSHGLHPPELHAGGLRAVLPDVPGVPDRVLAPALQVTAYLLAIDDPATRFEDDGTMLRVHRRQPLSDPALLDRVRVLGGSCGSTVVELPIDDR